MSETPPTQTPMSTPPGLGMGPSQEERTQALLSWVLSILTGFLAPLIFFLISNDKPFVKRHAAMCLGLQIVATIIIIILVITVVGILLAPVVSVACLVIAIMGAIAANKGDNYDVPGIGNMIANMFKV